MWKIGWGDATAKRKRQRRTLSYIELQIKTKSFICNFIDSVLPENLANGWDAWGARGIIWKGTAIAADRMGRRSAYGICLRILVEMRLFIVLYPSFHLPLMYSIHLPKLINSRCWAVIYSRRFFSSLLLCNATCQRICLFPNRRREKKPPRLIFTYIRQMDIDKCIVFACICTPIQWWNVVLVSFLFFVFAIDRWGILVSGFSSWCFFWSLREP